jgi:hypothetical protein
MYWGTLRFIFYFEDLPDGSCAIDGMACNMQDNIIQIVNDISSIMECRILCHDEQSCAYITFYGLRASPSLILVSFTHLARSSFPVMTARQRTAAVCQLNFNFVAQP